MSDPVKDRAPDGGWGRRAPVRVDENGFEPMFPGDDGSPDGWGRRKRPRPLRTGFSRYNQTSPAEWVRRAGSKG